MKRRTSSSDRLRRQKYAADTFNSFGDAEHEPPSKMKVWVIASRPHTLTASIAPVVVGATLAPLSYSEKVWPISVAFATFACLVQLGTNLHNDYADFVKGADDERRVGQARATQRGWLTPRETACGATICLTAASLIGAYISKLAGEACGEDFDLTFVLITASSVFNAVAYTGGPFPLGYIGLGSVSIGYSGLGDIFVFIYFGLVATLGVPYLCLRMSGNNGQILQLLTETQVLRLALLTAIPVGFLATAIIVVNNLRDRKTDVTAGKLTMAVRFGAFFARSEYALLVLGSYFAQFLLAKHYSMYAALPLLSFPIAIPQLRAVAFGEKDGSDLNAHIGGTARLQLLFCMLVSIGLQVSSK